MGVENPVLEVGGSVGSGVLVARAAVVAVHVVVCGCHGARVVGLRRVAAHHAHRARRVGPDPWLPILQRARVRTTCPGGKRWRWSVYEELAAPFQPPQDGRWRGSLFGADSTSDDTDGSDRQQGRMTTDSKTCGKKTEFGGRLRTWRVVDWTVADSPPWMSSSWTEQSMLSRRYSVVFSSPPLGLLWSWDGESHYTSMLVFHQRPSNALLVNALPTPRPLHAVLCHTMHNSLLSPNVYYVHQGTSVTEPIRPITSAVGSSPGHLKKSSAPKVIYQCEARENKFDWLVIPDSGQLGVTCGKRQEPGWQEDRAVHKTMATPPPLPSPPPQREDRGNLKRINGTCRSTGLHVDKTQVAIG